jgi:hypothetical protein
MRATKIVLLLALVGFSMAYRPIITQCTPEQKEAKFCPMIYSPVIGVTESGEAAEYPNACMACAAEGVVYHYPPEPKPAVQSTSCEGFPRESVLCSMIYQPVCATVKGSSVPVTYSNGCMACSDEKVISYTQGACEEKTVATKRRFLTKRK